MYGASSTHPPRTLSAGCASWRMLRYKMEVRVGCAVPFMDLDCGPRRQFMHVMIDIETLGTRPDAMITQIGAVLFEPISGGKILNGKGFNEYVLIQDGAGSIDNGAVAFWFQEASVAKMGKALAETASPLPDVLKRFVEWPTEVHGLTWEAIQGVWANPSDFDLPILKSAFSRCNADVPWDRRATRDARTLFSLVGGKPEIDWTGFTAHDALDDAVGQAMQVQKAMGLLT